MEKLHFRLAGGTPRPGGKPCLVGVAASGDLEVLIEPANLGGGCEVEIITRNCGASARWRTVMAEFHARHHPGDVRVSINDGGADPAIAALRLDAAIGRWFGVAAPAAHRRSFRAATARERLDGLLDAGRWTEFLPPTARITSPHLAEFDLPAAFDDGVAVGCGRLAGQTVFVAAQEGRFMGGAAGEVHSAKIVGLLQRAAKERPAAVLLLLDSGGVRLHEANAGLIGVSEMLCGIMALRALGVPVLALIGGASGCFGGIGIVARCCDRIIMSDEGRLGLSGPEVIETAHGPKEFDSKDRDLVWRTTGGRHRYLLGDCDRLVADDIGDFAAAAVEAIATARPFSLDSLATEHAQLAARARHLGGGRDAGAIWRLLGAPDSAALSRLRLKDFVVEAAAIRFAGRGKQPEIHPAEADSEDSTGNWRAVVDRLFPAGHTIRCAGRILTGEARSSGQTVAVVGTAGHALIGFEIALALAGEVLRVIQEGRTRPLVILVDTQGHRLSLRDEVLGLSSFMAHLAKCIGLARSRGHRTVGLVYDQAVSAGFFVTGLLAETCHALPGTRIQVMNLRAMARVMRLPEARLVALARSHPVFAPGVENFARMGTIESIWERDLAVHLADALQTTVPPDHRSALGLARGGRQLAHPVAQMVAGTDFSAT